MIPSSWEAKAQKKMFNKELNQFKIKLNKLLLNMIRRNYKRDLAD